MAGGGKAPTHISSSFKTILVATPISNFTLVWTHVGESWVRKQNVYQIWGGGDVFAFLGQKSLLTVDIPWKVKAAPFQEVIAHFLGIPETFCQNYPIPDHLN